jgi:hypothetical protein
MLVMVLVMESLFRCKFRRGCTQRGGDGGGGDGGDRNGRGSDGSGSNSGRAVMAVPCTAG